MENKNNDKKKKLYEHAFYIMLIFVAVILNSTMNLGDKVVNAAIFGFAARELLSFNDFIKGN